MPSAPLPTQQAVGGMTSPFLTTYRQAPQLLQRWQSPLGYPLELYVLGNGHRVLMEKRPTDIVSLRTFVNTGSVIEDSIYQSPLYQGIGLPSGIAHLDEHLHFLTTKNFPEKNSWVSTVEHMGAQLNASTGPEGIQHELTFNVEDTDAMIGLHGESVLGLTYNPTEIFQEKTNVINERFERTSTPDAKIYNKSMELMFDRPDFQSLGLIDDVKRTTTEDLFAFYREAYRPTNMLTVISGNIDPQKMLSQIDKAFGQNPPRISKGPQSALKLALKPGEVRSATVVHPKLSYSVVHLGFPAPPKANLKERMAMNFLVMLLDGDDLAPLPQVLKEQQKVASAVEMSYTPMKQTGFTDIYLHTNPGQEQQALQATLTSIQEASQKPIRPEKLDELKRRLSDGFQKGLNDVYTATMVMGDESMTGSIDYYLKHLELINSVTAEDIQATAQKYLDPNRYTVVYGLPGDTEQTSKNFSTLEGMLNPLPQPSVTGKPIEIVNTPTPPTDNGGTL